MRGTPQVLTDLGFVFLFGFRWEWAGHRSAALDGIWSGAFDLVRSDCLLGIPAWLVAELHYAVTIYIGAQCEHGGALSRID